MCPSLATFKSQFKMFAFFRFWFTSQLFAFTIYSQLFKTAVMLLWWFCSVKFIQRLWTESVHVVKLNKLFLGLTWRFWQICSTIATALFFATKHCYLNHLDTPFPRSPWGGGQCSTLPTSCCPSSSSSVWICPRSWSQTREARSWALRSPYCWLSQCCSWFSTKFFLLRPTAFHLFVNNINSQSCFRL